MKLPHFDPSSKELSDAWSAVQPVSGRTRPLAMSGESGEPGAALARLRSAGLAERPLALALSDLSAKPRNMLRKDTNELCGSKGSDCVRPGRRVAELFSDLLLQDTRDLETVVEEPPLAPPPPLMPRKTVRSKGVVVPLVRGDAPMLERPSTPRGEAAPFAPMDCQEDCSGSRGKHNDVRLSGVLGAEAT